MKNSMPKWFEKLNIEYPGQNIPTMISLEPKVYVDVLEKWFGEFRIKGLPNFIRDTMLEDSDFEYFALKGLTGDPVIPSSVLFNQFKCVDHIHEMIIRMTEKALPRLLNLKVNIPDNYKPMCSITSRLPNACS